MKERVGEAFYPELNRLKEDMCVCMICVRVCVRSVQMGRDYTSSADQHNVETGRTTNSENIKAINVTDAIERKSREALEIHKHPLHHNETDFALGM